MSDMPVPEQELPNIHDFNDEFFGREFSPLTSRGCSDKYSNIIQALPKWVRNHPQEGHWTNVIYESPVTPDEAAQDRTNGRITAWAHYGKSGWIKGSFLRYYYSPAET